MNARMTGWRRVWHDPVGSQLIVWAVIGVVSAIATYFLNWWPAIGQGLLTAWRFLWASSSLPNWLIAVLCLLALVAIVLVVGLALSAVRSEAVRSEAEPWKRYTSDEFFGLRWRWYWQSDGRLSELVPFCPRCNYPVRPEELSSYRAVHGLAFGFRCENESCGAELGQFDEPYERLQDKVRRHIMQRIMQKLRNIEGASNARSHLRTRRYGRMTTTQERTRRQTKPSSMRRDAGVRVNGNPMQVRGGFGV